VNTPVLVPVSVKIKVSSVVVSSDMLLEEIVVSSVIVSAPLSPKPSTAKLELRSVLFTDDLSVSSLPDVARNVHVSAVVGSMFNPLSSIVSWIFCPGTTMPSESVLVNDTPAFF